MNTSLSSTDRPGTTVVPAISVNDLGHTYRTRSGDRAVLRDVTFAAAPGEIVCVVGPSGVGKSTLLRCVAGLQKPSYGTVQVHGSAPRPGKSVGVVFQDYSRSLLPWATVVSNVLLPLRGRLPRAAAEQRARDALSEVGLSEHLHQRPWQLSGGMQQRVSIARAVAHDAPVLLMDEPFASVDAQTREELEDLTLRVRTDTNNAVVVITHDIDEAIYLADRIVVLNGRPASVSDELEVPFGATRSHIDTKARPEFSKLRRAVHDRLHANKPQDGADERG